MQALMNSNDFHWQLKAPISAISFDCDGTLSSLEGINELAKYANVKDRVCTLTSIAMSKTGINPSIYQERLKLVLPQQKDLLTLSHDYFNNRAPDILEVIEIFKRLGKTVYIISAGLNPAVSLFGEMLSIPKTNIYAVDLRFDASGMYLDYDQLSPLIHNDGKSLIISELKKVHPHLVHIGDGLNDASTQDIVTRFIGYGGFYYREHICNLCKFYIRSQSQAPLLPLLLTVNEYSQLSKEEKNLFDKGLNTINEGFVKLTRA